MKHLHHYHVWANERMLNHILQFPDVFRKPSAGPFSTIARTFGHIYDVDRLWFTRMKGTSLLAIGKTEFSDVQEAKEAFTALHKEMSQFLTLETDRNRMIHYENTEGASFQNTLSELVTHVVNHGTSHRGNVVVMLREAGYRSCPTDYIYFLRDL
ncbi:DinB family protein [Domibacillus sp. A3M-37]|uniref:DinB family protein n=1 Tax=Domibacillus sp. A3M-37 TaxID=2962037 RepID=UPI0020B6F43D|nr:DinB family protein [Domibacillus sp. A3M-37]MCP3763590.1 DinB family protein [Domibacillus sp. A3M-37]